MASRPTASEDRLFVREPFRHYRRSYSHAEVRWGLVVLAILVAITAWIAWKGARGDPDLFAASQPARAMALPGDQPVETAEGGPLSPALAPEGWSAGEISTFGPENLYVKINGRADYFLSYGFKRLYFMTLRAGDDDTSPVIDIEAYDLGQPANALGAFSGEEKDGEPTSAGGGLVYLSSNALFVARDRYYVRAIGSDGSDEVRAALEELRGALDSAIGGSSDRPWAYQLFSDHLEIAVDDVRFAAENALSFEFATDVYSALAGEDVQLFASLRVSSDEAAELAARLREGFASLGTAAKDGWVTDKFLGTVATAVAEGRYVIGVRGAADLEAGERHLAALREGLAALEGAADER